MIRNLKNNGAGQLFLGAVVVAIILTFLFGGMQSTGNDAADDCAVELDKICISPKEYRAAFQLLTSIGLRDSATKRLKLREKVGQGLAEREVLVAEAKRLGLGTSGDDIDAELLEGRTRVSLPAEDAEQVALNLALCVDGPTGCAPGTIGLRAITVKQNGKFDIDLYKRTVGVVSGRSPSHFKEMQEKEYTAERVRNLIRSQVRVSPEEAFLAYSRARSKATARVTEAKTGWFQRYVSVPGKDDLEVFADKHKAEIDAAVKETAEKWQVDCSVVSEIRLNNADPNGAETADIKAKAEKLKGRLSEGFDAVAREASEGESASLGGRVGCLDSGYGAGAATLMDAAKELKKAGDVSPVIETIRGFSILKLEGRVSAENKDQLVRDFVTYKLAAEDLAKGAAKKFAEDLIAKVAGGEAMDAATAALVKEALEGGPFKKEDSVAYKAEDAPKTEISRSVGIEQSPIAGALPEESPAVTLFDLEKEDEVAKNPIATRDGFAVLQLKEKDMITKEKFEEERTQIMTSLQKRKAEQALANYVARLIQQAGGIRLNPKYIPPSEEDKKEKDS